MAEIQASSPVLAASAGQGASAGGAAPAANGFFAQALAGSMAASAPTAGANPGSAAIAGQPLVLNIPAAFLLSSVGAQPGMAAGAAVTGQAAQANPLLAAIMAGEGAASALFDKLVNQLAALGVGGGDPEQVAAQLAALGVGGDPKQALSKLLASVEGGAKPKSLEDALGQVAQALGAGQIPDPALLGALAAQLQALQGAVSASGGKVEKAADIAVGRKGLPATTAGEPNTNIGGNAVGNAVSTGVGSGAALSGQAKFAAQDGGAAQDAAETFLAAKGVVAEDVATASDAVKLLATAIPAVQTDSGAARVDGFTGITAAGAPKAASQEALLVRTPMRAPGWDADFAQKVVWMVGRESQSAQLVLNPPQMGTVEVRLTMSGGEAGAQFFSPHQGVREALETALPRLREMMAEAGLSLGQASVSSESFRDQRANGGEAGRMAGLSAEDEAKNAALAASTGLSSHIAQGRGLVDLYV